MTESAVEIQKGLMGLSMMLALQTNSKHTARAGQGSSAVASPTATSSHAAVDGRGATVSSMVQQQQPRVAKRGRRRPTGLAPEMGLPVLCLLLCVVLRCACKQP